MATTLIAKIRATSKSGAANQKYNGEGVSTDPKNVKARNRTNGKDGRKFYDIGLGANGGIKCSCPSFKFGRGKLCKHIIALLSEAPSMIAADEKDNGSIKIFQEGLVMGAVARYEDRMNTAKAAK